MASEVLAAVDSNLEKDGFELERNDVEVKNDKNIDEKRREKDVDKYV